MKDIKNNPTVSVVIPTYNRAHLVGRAIQSVLNQTYQDFELIVVDDGSTDNTKKGIKSFKDHRICYIRYRENRRASAARNVGIRIAKGDFISFLDDDDEYLPNFLEELIQVFQNSQNVQMAIGKVKIYNENGEINMEPQISIKEDFLRELIPLPCTIPLNSFILKKQYVEYFDITLSCYQDVDFVMRLAKKGLRFTYKNIPVAIYHCDQKRKRTAGFKKIDIEIGEFLIKKHKDFLMKWPLYYTEILFNHSRKLFSSGKVSKVSLFLKDTLPVNPFCLLHWSAFVLIFTLRIVKFLFRLFPFHTK